MLGKWVLLPGAEIAREALPEAIFNAGGVPPKLLFIEHYLRNQTRMVAPRSEQAWMWSH